MPGIYVSSPDKISWKFMRGYVRIDRIWELKLLYGASLSVYLMKLRGFILDDI